MYFADNVDAIEFSLIHAHKEGTVVNVSDDIPDGGKEDELEKALAEEDYHFLKPNRIVATGGPIPDGLYSTIGVPISGQIFSINEYATRQQAVEEVAKADPKNIQEVAASLLKIINSYYESGLHQSKRSFIWSLIWGTVGLCFLIAAIAFLLIREPTEVAVASGAIGVAVGAFASRYHSLYKLATGQLAEFRTSIERTQRLLLANSMCEMLKGDIEQTKRAELISRMVESAVRYSPKNTVDK